MSEDRPSTTKAKDDAFTSRNPKTALPSQKWSSPAITMPRSTPPNVSDFSSLRGVFHEDHIVLARHLRSLSVQGLLGPEALNPAFLPRPLLPRMMIWRFNATEAGQDRFTCGLMGTELVARLGFDLSRKSLADCPNWFCKSHFQDILEDVVNGDGHSPRIVMHVTSFTVADGKVTCQQSAYPIFNKDGDLDRILLFARLDSFICQFDEIFRHARVDGFEWRQRVKSLEDINSMSCTMESKTFVLSSRLRRKTLTSFDH